ncbi:MAG TPA: hypothetical protein VKA68_01560 [bacterium]|nr:hypothetical protein [bacterium]
MKNIIKSLYMLCSIYFLFYSISAQPQHISPENIPYKMYPEVNDVRPDLPSPFTTTDGREFVVAVTNTEQYAIIPVTLRNERSICQQLVVDSLDFPGLVKTGIHSREELNHITSITGRSLAEITRLGRPGGLSQSGFLAADEDILSVIRVDNRIVQALGLTHPQLAKPLFHVLNMMDEDLALNRWNMAHHRWENIRYFFYNNKTVFVDAEDTKGGQQSIFDDGIEGGFYIKVWREFDKEEMHLLQQRYGHLSPVQFDSLQMLISIINTGEMEPQYIMRYGFYEGHTFWRTDPIALSFIFGIKSLAEIEEVFEGDLYNILTTHFNE